MTTKLSPRQADVLRRIGAAGYASRMASVDCWLTNGYSHYASDIHALMRHGLIQEGEYDWRAVLTDTGRAWLAADAATRETEAQS